MTFETLASRDEARFEWMAVYTAVTEAFPGGKCDAVVAGGNGSVQVSVKHEFKSAPLDLGNEVLRFIHDEGVDA